MRFFSMTSETFESEPQRSTADERWSGVENRRAAGGAGRVTKVVVLGHPAVGKTSVIRRFAKGEFLHKYRATIGADFLSKTLTVDGLGGGPKTVVLQVWDTAGQEVYKALSSVFFRGADACIMVCAADDRRSLMEGVPSWLGEFRAKQSASAACVVLAVTKTDVEQWQFTKAEVEEVARNLGDVAAVLFVSSLTGDGVDDLFSFVASQIVRTIFDAPSDVANPTLTVSVTVDPARENNKPRECLCRSC